MNDLSLHPDLSAGVHALRGALTDLLYDVGADVSRPQEMSRRLSLDKNLAWKLSRIVGAGDAQDALQYIPGDAALGIVMRAVHDAGGAEVLRRRAEGAIRNFQAAVLRHLGDRPTLDLVVDGLPSENGERLSVSRKLAFRGNSGIWGVQAKSRLNTIIIAPNPTNRDMMDVVLVGGWVDFRRIRGDSRWVLFRRQPYNTDGTFPAEEPIDSSPAIIESDGPLLMQDFCSQSLPEIHTTREDHAFVDELGSSTIGNSGAFTAFFGSVTRALGSRFGDFEGDVAQFPANISAPVESLQFDMIVHRDCTFAFKQKVKTFSALSAVWPTPLNDRDLLPIHVDQSELGSEPPIVQSPLFPRYRELIDRVYTRMNWNQNEFTGTRYTVQYPPFPSTVVISFPLETPPGGYKTNGTNETHAGVHHDTNHDTNHDANHDE